MVGISDAVAYEMLLKFQTVHLRHLKVDNQAFRKTGRQRREKFLSRSIRPGTKSVRTQQPAQGLEHGWIIVHNSNPWGSFRHERLLRSRRAPVELALGPIGTCSLLRKVELLGHANEIGDDANAQFLHHPAAVDLDGLFDRTQIAGNLLVEPSRHDMRKTLRVRAGSGSDLRLHRFHLGMKPTRHSVPGFSTGYRFEQILVLHGFGQEIDRAGFHGAHAGRECRLFR